MTGRPVNGTPRVFRAPGGRLLLAASAAGAVVILVDILVRADLRTLLLLAPWVLLVLWSVYVAAVASRISADQTGVEVQNLLRRTRVPWGRVTGIEMRWQIEISLDDGPKLVCFGGPSRSRPRRLGAGREKEQAFEETDVVAALRRLRADAAAPSEDPIRRGWDVPACVTLLALCAWAAAAVFVAYGV